MNYLHLETLAGLHILQLLFVAAGNAWWQVWCPASTVVHELEVVNNRKEPEMTNVKTLAGLGVAGRLTDRKDASSRDFCCRTPIQPVTGIQRDP